MYNFFPNPKRKKKHVLWTLASCSNRNKIQRPKQNSLYLLSDEKTRHGSGTWRPERKFIHLFPLIVIINHTREIQRFTLITHQDRFLPNTTITPLQLPFLFLLHLLNKRHSFVAYVFQQLLRWLYLTRHRGRLQLQRRSLHHHRHQRCYVDDETVRSALWRFSSYYVDHGVSRMFLWRKNMWNVAVFKVARVYACYSWLVLLHVIFYLFERIFILGRNKAKWYFPLEYIFYFWELCIYQLITCLIIIHLFMWRYITVLVRYRNFMIFTYFYINSFEKSNFDIFILALIHLK